MQEVILNNYEIFLKIHFIGFILGLGAATISDIMFFKFLKDFKIDKFEYETLKTLSNTIWVGVVLFVLSGIALFIGKYEILIEADSFLAKATIATIVILNGIFLHHEITPKLNKLKMIGKAGEKDLNLRKKALIGGVISVTSWYSVLFLAINKGYGYEYSQIMGLYIALLLSGITFLLTLNRIFNK